MKKIILRKEITGNILDIGGGGEGIIGCIYPEQVTAIDNRLDELEEAPDGPIKIVMDAREMTFVGKCFDNVTAFYSFMYIPKIDHLKVIAEISRVLKNNGYLHIWDAVIKEAKPFLAELDINANGNSVQTTYGIVKEDATQDAFYFKSLMESSDFTLVSETDNQGDFYQRWQKIR